MRASTAVLFVSFVACASHEEGRGPREIARAPGPIEPRAPRVTVEIEHESPCKCLEGHGPDNYAINVLITDERDERERRSAYIHLPDERGAATSSVGPAWVVVIVDGKGRAWPYDGKGDGLAIPGALDGALIDWTADRMIVAREREVRVLDSTKGFAELAHWTLPAPATALAASPRDVAVASTMGVAIHALDTGALRWRLAVTGAAALAWNGKGTELSIEIPGPTTVTYSVP